MAITSLGIAGIVAGIESDGLAWGFRTGGVHSRFCLRDAAPDVRVQVRVGVPRDLDWGVQVVTESFAPAQPDPELSLYRNYKGAWIVDALSRGWADNRRIYARRVGVFNPDFSSGQVFLELTDAQVSPYPFPLQAPLDRALFAHRLPYHDGLLLHAAAVVHQGRALVFTGQSGRGKSTMAGLWAASGQGLVLGEESTALRRVGSEIRAYGTPWAGQSGLASPLGAPVAGLFFLRHGPHNTVRSMGPAEAMAEFLPRSYLAPYDPIGAARGLEFLHHLIATVPMAELAFRPDADVVELLASGRWADGLA